MSSNNNIPATRRWMYERIDHRTNDVSTEYYQELKNFIRFAKNQ
ncbi:unnamed protein product, partial [Arabidopsis halleri]